MKEKLEKIIRKTSSGILTTTMLLGPGYVLGGALNKPAQQEVKKEIWWEKLKKNFSIENLRTYPQFDAAFQHLNKGRFNEAKKEFEKIVNIYPDNVAARMGLAYLSKDNLNDLASAAEHLEYLKGKNIGPTGKILLELGDIYKKLEQPLKAIENFELARGLKVHDPMKVEASLGYLYFGQEKWEKAVENFSEVLKKDEMDLKTKIDMMRGLGFAYDGKGDYGNAVKTFSSVLEEIKNIKPEEYGFDKNLEYELLSNLGFVEQKRNNADKSIEYFQKALELNANDFDVYKALGNLYYQKSDLENALVHFTEALKLKDGNELHVRLANIFEAKGNIDTAMEEYKSLLSRDISSAEEILYNWRLSNLYEKKKDIRSSIAHLEDALELNENDLLLNRRMGNLLFKVKEYGKSVDHFKKALQIEHNEVDVFRLSVALESAGKIKEAISVLKNEIKTNEKIYLLARIGGLYEKLGEYSKAVPFFNQANEIKHYPENLLAEARLRFKIGDYKGAESVYGAFNKLVPNSFTGFLELANTSEMGGNLEKALNEFEKSRGLAKDVSSKIDLTKKLGFINFMLGDYTKAKSEFENVIKLDEKSKEVYDALGVVRFELKDFKGASEAFSNSLTIKDDLETRLRLANTYYMVGDIENSAKEFEILLGYNLDKNDALTITNSLAEIYFGLGNFKQAKKYNDLNIALDENQQNLLRSVYILKNLGRDGSAVTGFSKLLKLNINDDLRHMVLSDRGLLHMKLGEYKDAKSSFIEASKIKDVSANVLYSLGIIHEKEGNTKEAIDYLSMALALNPEYKKEILSSLGFLNLKVRNDKDALSNFKEVLQIDPTHAFINEQAAYLHMRFGQNKEAKKKFEKAGVLYGKPSNLEEEVRRKRIEMDLGRLKRRVGISGYVNFVNPALPDIGNLYDGAISSQMGVRLFGKPIFKNEKEVEVFARLLGNFQSDSYKVDEESLVAGGGVSYKPFKKADFKLSAEGIFPLSEDNTLEKDLLVRATYNALAGKTTKLDKKVWNKAEFLVDLAYFAINNKKFSAYGRVMEGASVRLGDNFVITPYAAVTGRYTDPADVGNYIMGGPGLSFELKSENENRALRFFVEYMIGQYFRGPHKDDKFNGPRVGVQLRF